MLINTVILFIRDTLPVFLLFSLLLAQRESYFRYLCCGILAGFCMALVLYLNVSYVSEWFDGGGLELIKTAVLIGSLGCLGEFIARHYYGESPNTSWLSVVLMTGITFINVVHFIIYFLAYWSAPDAGPALVLGNIIGLGISLSVGVLLYMLVNAIQVHLFKLVFLTVFIAGQIAGIAMLLEQIDMLPGQNRLWDTSAWVADESEYGHFLNVLVGYEATPTGAYLFIYLSSLLFPVLYCYLRSLLAGNQGAAGRLK